MASNLMPGWMQDVSRFNPVNWTVVAARGVASADVDWAAVGLRAGLLAALLLACSTLATRALRVYQRSV
jgi:ABC-2 type transport system permease protein